MTNLAQIQSQSLYSGTLSSPINGSQTGGLILSPIPVITGKIYITLRDPLNPEVISATGVTGGGELTGVVRGLPLYDGGPSTAVEHASGIRVLISNPYQAYEDIQDAVNSKLDRVGDTAEDLKVDGWIEFPVYADAAARDVAIAAPVLGQSVILEDDGDGNTTFSTYDGSGWKNISAPLRDITVNGWLRFPVYADATARDTAIPAPLQSMVVYNQNAVTLQLFDGSNWIDLDIGTPVPLATQSVPGRVRLATDQQVIDGVDDVSGDPLVMQPSQLGLSSIVEAVLEEDMTAGTPVGISHYLSQSNIHVAKARKAFIDSNLGEEPYVRKVIALDSTRVFILFGNMATASAGNLKAVIATVNLDGSPPSFGSIETVSAGVLGIAYSCDIIDTDKIAINYILSATDTVIRCKIATITGDSIALSAEQDVLTLGSAIQTSGGAEVFKVVAIDTDKVSVFASTATTTNSRVVVYSVSGTTITAGTGVLPSSNLRVGTLGLLRLATDKFLLIRGGSTTGYSQVATIAGETITLGSEETFTTGGTTAASNSIALEDDKVLITFIDTSSGSPNNVKVITYSGSAIDTEGTAVPIPDFLSGSGLGLLLRSPTVVWGFGGASLFAYQMDITGTSVSFTLLGRSFNIITSQSGQSSVSGEQEVVMLNGRAIKFTRSGANNLRFQREGMAMNLAGVLTESGSRGDARRVKLFSSPLDSNLSLRGGEYYRIGGNNAISDGELEMALVGAVASGSAIGTRSGEILAIDEDKFLKL